MTAAFEPTTDPKGIAWSVQSNAASSGGTGPSHMGTVAGKLGFTASTVNGIAQGKTGGASGPMSATYAEPSGAGAVSIAHEKLLRQHAAYHQGDPSQGVY